LQCADEFFRSTRGDQLVCPLCKKSVEAPSEQEGMRALIAAHVDAHPMPEEFRGMRARILCNDCLAHTVTDFRFDYNMCQADGCGSYNTDVIDRLAPEEGAPGAAGASAAAPAAMGLGASLASAAAAAAAALSAALAAGSDDESDEEDDEYEDGEESDEDDDDDQQPQPQQ